MLPLIAVLLSNLVTADPKPEVPAKLELFAKEDWYVGTKAKEQVFEGVLKRNPDKGKAFGRFNPCVLEMKTETREVYVGGKPNLLEPYVGNSIKLTGKPVDMNVEGKEHHEIWPARLEVVRGDKAKDLNQESQDAKGKEVKVLARAVWPHAKIDPAAIPPPGGGQQQWIIRSEEDLLKAAGKDAVAQVAKSLKVEKIDFKTQMLVAVSGGVRRSGGFRVEVTKVEVDEKGKTMTVHWQLHFPKGAATAVITHAAEVVLLDRFEGEIKFNAAPTTREKPQDPGR